MKDKSETVEASHATAKRLSAALMQLKQRLGPVVVPTEDSSVGHREVPRHVAMVEREQTCAQAAIAATPCTTVGALVPTSGIHWPTQYWILGGDDDVGRNTLWLRSGHRLSAGETWRMDSRD